MEHMKPTYIGNNKLTHLNYQQSIYIKPGSIHKTVTNLWAIGHTTDVNYWI